ncbi:hypothetical protein BHE74_00016999 [Ensete ventricosum]|nr:hypothetical protein BHE74_00016999 [Ensete ventricosum]
MRFVIEHACLAQRQRDVDDLDIDKERFIDVGFRLVAIQFEAPLKQLGPMSNGYGMSTSPRLVGQPSHRDSTYAGAPVRSSRSWKSR